MHMRFFLSPLTVGFCFLTGVLAQAQKVDWANAPLNPVPVPYKAEHFNLKGPIYSADKKVFDANGLLIKEQSFVQYEDGQPTGKGSVSWELDAEGNVVRETYYGGRDTHFTYREGLLVEERYEHKGEAVVKTYAYDDAGRLNSVSSGEGEQAEITTYSYTADGRDVQVVETVQRGSKPPKRHHKTYRDGHLIASRTEGEPIELVVEYVFDDYGNPTRQVYAQNNGVRDEFTMRNQYYPDLQRRNELTYGSLNDKKLYPSLVFRNGQVAGDIVFTQRPDKSGFVVYDDFSNSYFFVDEQPDRKPGDRIVAKPLAADTEVIVFRDGNTIEPYLKGQAIFSGSKNKIVSNADGDLITHSETERFTRETSLFIDLEPEKTLLRGKLIQQTFGYFKSHIIFSVSETGIIELFYEAERVEDLLDLEQGVMGENDLVLIRDGKPTYVLPDALVQATPGVYKARYYGRDSDSYELLGADRSLKDASKAKQARPYAFGIPVSVEEVDGLYRFYQKEERITAPEVYVINGSGTAFAFYPTASYHLFGKGKGLPSGQVEPEAQVIIDPLLVEQDAGRTRVWWNGQRVPDSDFTLLACDDGSRLLYLKPQGKHFRVLPESLLNNYHAVEPLNSPNVLVKNSDGLICVIRGEQQAADAVELNPYQGNLLVSLDGEPSFVLSYVTSVDELEPGLYPLKDFSY